MIYPKHAVTLPATLGGQPNGKLSASLLVRPGFPGRPAATLHALASRAWLALAAEVLERFGETLSVTSTADAYRTYAVQESTFRNRYTTDRLAGRRTKVWNGRVWWQKPGMAMAAVPGTSNHGWGLAVDACLWRDNQIVGITANMSMFSWLLLNAFRFGFSWEDDSEPWHLRYYAGDQVPQAVLDHEAPPAPTFAPTPLPTPTPDDEEDDDMAYPTILARHATSGQFYVTDRVTYARKITPAEAEHLRDDLKVPVGADSGPFPLSSVESDFIERIASS